MAQAKNHIVSPTDSMIESPTTILKRKQFPRISDVPLCNLIDLDRRYSLFTMSPETAIPTTARPLALAKAMTLDRFLKDKPVQSSLGPVTAQIITEDKPMTMFDFIRVTNTRNTLSIQSSRASSVPRAAPEPSQMTLTVHEEPQQHRSKPSTDMLQDASVSEIQKQNEMCPNLPSTESNTTYHPEEHISLAAECSNRGSIPDSPSGQASPLCHLPSPQVPARTSAIELQVAVEVECCDEAIIEQRPKLLDNSPSPPMTAAIPVAFEKGHQAKVSLPHLQTVFATPEMSKKVQTPQVSGNYPALSREPSIDQVVFSPLSPCAEQTVYDGLRLSTPAIESWKGIRFTFRECPESGGFASSIVTSPTDSIPNTPMSMLSNDSASSYNTWSIMTPVTPSNPFFSIKPVFTSPTEEEMRTPVEDLMYKAVVVEDDALTPVQEEQYTPITSILASYENMRGRAPNRDSLSKRSTSLSPRPSKREYVHQQTPLSVNASPLDMYLNCIA